MQKMKIYIHSCNKRLEYVKNYLVPSLQDQGLTDITIFNDSYQIGNLMSFTLSLKNVSDGWHLQDDVIICRDFAKRIKDLDGIVCGFSASEYEPSNYMEGKTTAAHIGYSFPCIRIPGKIAREFLDWFYKESTQKKHSAEISSGKMDDLLFNAFLMEEKPNEKIINLNPSLVEHIDYLLGGSEANKAREGKTKIVKATNFQDSDLTKHYETILINYGKEDANK